MKYSTRTRYGLRLLVYLGARYKGKFVKLHTIAESEKISIKYLEQIVRILKPTGLINVARGAKGGYKLAKDPVDIDMKQIFTILEGNIEPIECLQESYNCKKEKLCATLDLWKGLQKVTNEYLSSIKLIDVIENYKSKHSVNMFYI